MRWKTKPAPKHDERRIVKRFAFVPIMLSDGEDWGNTVWLESYFQVQQYYCGDSPCWEDLAACSTMEEALKRAQQ